MRNKYPIINPIALRYVPQFDIAAHGASRLFGTVAFGIALENQHRTEAEEAEQGVIHLTHGHSKDKRPDLNPGILVFTKLAESLLPARPCAGIPRRCGRDPFPAKAGTIS